MPSPSARARWSCAGSTTIASWSACRRRNRAVSGTPRPGSVRTASCWWPSTAWRAGGDLLRVWHLGRRELLGSLQSRGGGAFYGGAFSPDSRRLLFCPPEGGIAVWDRGERRVVRRLPLDFAPNYLALDPEGRRLAVNNADGAAPRVAILELETGRVLADWRSQVGNANLAWSADGQLLAVGSYTGDCRVYVWNVRRGELASVLQGHTAYIIDAQFAHAGYLLATASWDGTTRLWDAASGELLATAPGSALGSRRMTAGWPSGSVGAIGVWDVAAGDECRTLHPAMLGNRGERRDATEVSIGRVQPRRPAAGDRRRGWRPPLGGRHGPGAGPPQGWRLRRRAVSPRRSEPHQLRQVGPVSLADPSRSRARAGRDPCRAARAAPRNRTAHEWNKATWLPDHRTLALIDNAQARVLLVDSSHPHPAWSRATALDSGENRRMTSVAVSPDGRWLAVGGWKEAGVRVWDLHRRRLERLLRPNDAVGDMSFFVGFSPDGRWLISSTASDSGNRYHFWRAGTWELGRRIDQERHGGGLASASIHRRRPADGPGDRPRPGAAGRRRDRSGARAADDLAVGQPHAAGLQPRRHEAGRQHPAKDRSGVGPAADPRPARPAGAGLGRAAVSRVHRERGRSRCQPDPPAEAGAGRRRSPRASGAAPGRACRDGPPARRQPR